MKLNPAQEKQILTMKVELTSEITKINARSSKLNILQRFISMLELPEPVDMMGDKMTDAEFLKFYDKVVAKYSEEFSKVSDNA